MVGYFLEDQVAQEGSSIVVKFCIIQLVFERTRGMKSYSSLFRNMYLRSGI
jgi:hypothetical protein